MVARINEQIDDLIHIANLSSLDISGIGIGSPLFTSVQAYINQFALNLAGCKTKVVSASLDQDAGVIGAATLCFTDSDRKSTRLNSSHVSISYAVFCLKIIT